MDDEVVPSLHGNQQSVADSRARAGGVSDEGLVSGVSDRPAIVENGVGINDDVPYDDDDDGVRA
jgi:hypothetical protein